MLKIGYVDEDEGQRNSFYHFLKDDFEVVLIDITEDTNVENLVDEIIKSGLDVLVLDYMLSENGLVEFNAESLVDTIYEINKHYPLVILTSHETDALDQIANAHLINGKDDMLGQKLPIFKQKLTKIAIEYKNEIKNSEAELKDLENKRLSKGLSAAEEDRYVELNSFLDMTVDSKGRVSRTFYSEETNKKLDNLIDLAEKMLKKLPDKE